MPTQEAYRIGDNDYNSFPRAVVVGDSAAGSSRAPVVLVVRDGPRYDWLAPCCCVFVAVWVVTGIIAAL